MNEDAGLRIVREVFEELLIDAGWSMREDRGFNVVAPSPCPKVWSEIPREDDGFSVARVNSEIDLFSADEQDWRQLAPVVDAASSFASLSGYLWSGGVVRLRCGRSLWALEDLNL